MNGTRENVVFLLVWLLLRRIYPDKRGAKRKLVFISSERCRCKGFYPLLVQDLSSRTLLFFSGFAY